MRTLSDYENAFGQISDQVLSRDFNTKAEARHLVAVANNAVRKARDVFTQEITFDWKEGFKKLKAENDRLQEECKIIYEQEVNACHEYDMRCRDSCDDQFPKVAGGIRSGYVMCVRQCGIEHSACLKACRDNRVAKVREITARWKDGFAALKAENDQMQKDLAAAFKSEMQMIGERFGDMCEGLQK